MSRLMVTLFVIAASLASINTASAETRTLKMYFTHTKESATITFKKNGKYIPSGLKEANRFLRDWRRKEPTRMDPKLLDIVWEIYKKSGSRKKIHVISGYRSPRTNNMLRRRGRGVARNSQHTRGKALDFFLPDVSVAKLRRLGLRAHRGGVGFYSGSFVHIDTGRVRHWPKISRRALTKIFPKGKTVHVPSDGRPLKGYKVARANLKKGLNADGSRRRSPKAGGGSLIASIFSSKKPKKPVAVAKKPKAKPAVKVPTPTAVAKAKPAGADPFAAELETAKKTAATKKADEAKAAELAAKAVKTIKTPETATPEPNVVAVLSADKVPVPVRRPSAPAVALAALTAPTPAPVAPATNQTITLAAPSSLTTALRPPADVAPVAQALNPVTSASLRPSPPAAIPTTTQQAARPQQTVEIASLQSDQTPVRRAPVQSATLPEATPKAAPNKAEGNAEQIATLNENIRKALARRRVLTSNTTPAEVLAAQVKAKQNPVIDLARLAVPRAADRSGLRPSQDNSPLAPAVQTAALDNERFGNVTTPKPRTAARPATPAARVPVPDTALDTVKTATASRMRAELSLGNLDGGRVKTWAIVESTRVGPVAQLIAPKYAQGTRRPAPKSVFSHGFGEPGPRLRADRFTGRALTRVAFAHFSSLN